MQLLQLRKESLKKFQACKGFESWVYHCDDNFDNLLSYYSSPRSSHIWLSYIHNFRIFFLNHFAPPSKGELMPTTLFFFFGVKVHVIISLNLIAFIISIETEASLLALAKSI